MEKIKVLIIEDDMILSDMYTKKLEKEGFEVKQAKDGLEGLIILENFSPDVILLEIKMTYIDWF